MGCLISDPKANETIKQRVQTLVYKVTHVHIRGQSLLALGYVMMSLGYILPI